MKLIPFLPNQTDHYNPMSSSSSSSSSTSTWPWPSCTQTRTLSFRATNDIFKTMNTTFLDNTTMSIDDVAESPHEHNSTSLSTKSSPANDININVKDDPVEAVIQGLRSERLFFVEPGETSSILEEANCKPKTTQLSDDNIHDEEEFVIVPFKESVALSLDSQNPYLDFKVSMEEMVEAHGIKEWEGLEELLCWYLKINGKDNHGYVVGAFVDLLVGLAFNVSTSANTNTNTKTNANTSNNNNNNNNITIKSCRCSNCDHSPCSPLSFCNTSSSSYSSSASSSISSSSSTPNCVSSLIGVISDQEIETPCLSSLLESTEEEINEEEDDDVSS